jgi:hypothetical protein
MNVFTLLSYINKVSLLVFVVTTLVVGYQIYVLRKEKTKEKTPSIPDFKEKNNLNAVANFTILPSSLTKKELKAVNYSKMVFLIISLLTIIIVVFVISLINKNGSSTNQALVNPPVTVSQTPVRKSVSPTPKVTLIPTFTATLSAELLSPTVEPTIDLSSSPSAEPTFMFQESQQTSSTTPTIVPTEIILAQAPSLTPILNLTNGQGPTEGVLKVLPETGSFQKVLLIIGVAISTIFFSFWF